MKSVICENCGASNAVDNWLCIKCGAKIAQVQDFREVELPQVKSSGEKTDWDSYGTRGNSGDLTAGDGLFSIVSKAFKKYLAGIWLFFGVYWIFSMATIIAGFIVWMVTAILPIFVLIAAWMIAPVYIGVWHAYLVELRGGQCDFADAFEAMRVKYLTAFKATALTEVISWVISFPLALIIASQMLFYLIFSGVMWEAPSPGENPVENIWRIGGSSIITVTILNIFIRMWFMFAFAIIADEQVGARKAVGASVKFVIHYFLEVLGITLIASVILVAGALLLGVGILFTIPFYYFILASYYVARKPHFEI